MSTPHLRLETGLSLSETLMECARLRGLDWVIEYADSAIEGFPRQREPYAFRLVAENGTPVVPAQVIGESLIESWECISGAASAKRRLDARTKQR